jgi:uncharacterized protein YjbJ (UPF0337 family)
VGLTASRHLVQPADARIPFDPTRPMLHGQSIDRGTAMNEDTLKGKWKQLEGKMKEQWGKLTDDDFKQAEGSSEYLAGKVQERYGIAKDEAERQVKDFRDNIDHNY